MSPSLVMVVEAYDMGNESYVMCMSEVGCAIVEAFNEVDGAWFSHKSGCKWASLCSDGGGVDDLQDEGRVAENTRSVEAFNEAVWLVVGA